MTAHHQKALIEFYQSRGFMVFRVRDTIKDYTSISALSQLVSEAVKRGITRIAAGFPPREMLPPQAIATLVKCFQIAKESNATFALIAPEPQLCMLLSEFSMMDGIYVVEDEAELGTVRR